MVLLLAVAVILGVLWLARRTEAFVGLLTLALMFGGAALIRSILTSSVLSVSHNPVPNPKDGVRTTVSGAALNVPDPSEPNIGQVAPLAPEPKTPSPAPALITAPSPTASGSGPDSATSAHSVSFTADFHKYVAGAWLSPDQLPFANVFSWQSNGQTPVGTTGVIQKDWYTCNPTGRDWGYDPAMDAVQAEDYTALPDKPQAQLDERMIFFDCPQAAGHALNQVAADFTACKAVTSLPSFGTEGPERITLAKTPDIEEGFSYLHTTRTMEGTFGNGVGHWGTDAHEYFVQRGNVLVLISLFAQDTPGGEAIDVTSADPVIMQDAADHLAAPYTS